MKKLFTLFTLMAALFTLPAAHAQDAEKAIAEAHKTLEGTWNWTESRFASRGVQPTVKTPESTQEKVSVTFRPGNVASIYINKKLAGTYQYTITKPMNEYLMIRFKANEGQPLPEYLQEGPLTFADNELFISGGYNDAGQNVTFRRAGTMPAPVKPEVTPAKEKTEIKEPGKKTTIKKKAATHKKQPVTTKTAH